MQWFCYFLFWLVRVWIHFMQTHWQFQRVFLEVIGRNACRAEQCTQVKGCCKLFQGDVAKVYIVSRESWSMLPQENHYWGHFYTPNLICSGIVSKQYLIVTTCTLCEVLTIRRLHVTQRTYLHMESIPSHPMTQFGDCFLAVILGQQDSDSHWGLNK